MNILKYIVKTLEVTIIAIAFWTMVFVMGTLNGSWHRSITNENKAAAKFNYVEAVKADINSQIEQR